MFTKQKKDEEARFNEFIKHKEDPGNDSGQGDDSRLPQELFGLNWGALLLNFVWGLAMKIPWTWLHVVPIIGFIMPFVFLFRGNEWAWKYRRWDSIEHFKKVQDKWLMAGIIFTVISFILSIALMSWTNSMMMKLLAPGKYY
ncbi:hypothetical protein K9N50_01560 [bacterium]|nr:hypothetical protein [bacterium]